MLTHRITVSLILALSGIGHGAPALRAADPAEPDSWNVPRYLFVVDTSFSMARLKPAIYSILSTTILDGMNGRIAQGERIGLWTFNERVSREFAPMAWDRERAHAIAEIFTEYLSRQRFENQTRLAPVLRELQHAIESTRDLTILLITDGDTDISGTPFDQSLNRFYSRHRRALRQVKQPFVTALVSKDRMLAAWAVTAGGTDIIIPDAPESIRTFPVTALPATNQSAVLPETAIQETDPPAAEFPQAPDPGTAPSPASLEPVAPDPLTIGTNPNIPLSETVPELAQSSPPSPNRSESAEESVLEPPLGKLESSDSVATAQPPSGSSPPLASAGRPDKVPLRPAAGSAPGSDSARPPGSPNITQRPHNADASAAARTGQARLKLPNSAVPSDSQPSIPLASAAPNPIWYLIIGLLLLASAASLLYWHLRSPRTPKPSLISQSIQDQRKD